MSNRHADRRGAKKALFLTSMMLFASWSAVLAGVPFASAHEADDVVSWPLSGSNDTGWIQLDAILGNDPILSNQATADWILEFAPGAEISNVSLQVHVNGSNGLMINEPLLVANDIGINLFDWRGLGTLGASDSFDGANPYSDRLSPNSASGAGWTLPSDADITELAFEALAPVDPITSFAPVSIPLYNAVQHPSDGQLYLQGSTSILVLDAKNDPAVIDLYDFDDLDSEIVGIAIGPSGNIHVAFADGMFKLISQNDGTVSDGLPDAGFEIGLFEVLPSGIYVMTSDGTLLQHDASNAWSQVVSATSNSWPSSTRVNDLHEQGGILYAATNNGVGRYDLNNNQPLSTWSSANVLHSNDVTKMETAGNQLLFASSDNGLARYNWNSGFWLATWSDANWLPSNVVSGIQSHQDTLHIMSGDQLLRYNLTTGVFGSSIPLSNVNLTESGFNALFDWDANGERAPSSMMHVATDGGRIALIDASMQSTVTREIVLASGPSDAALTDALEHNGILYVAGYFSETVDRLDIASSVWLTPIDIGNPVTSLAATGGTIIAGTLEDGLFLIENGSIRTNIPPGANQDANSEYIVDIAAVGDCTTTTGCQILFVQEYSAFRADVDSTAVGSATQLASNTLLTGQVATYAGVGYWSSDEGLLRYDIANDTFLAAWGSTGVNGVDNAPVAVVGDVLHMGLAGYGVARKDLSTGEILTPITSQNSIMTSNTIYALEVNGNDLWIGTQLGGYIWDGSSMTQLTTSGSDWTRRPSQHFDFEYDGNWMYSGTNIGVCRYSPSNGAIDDCLNVYDGMPNWATYVVGANSTTVFGGTFSGVGLIDKSSFTVEDEWEATSSTSDAIVEVIDDVVYIGLTGIGVARWDITNSEWLTTWTEDNVLDNGNEDVTSLIADIRPGYIWVGGRDGFQLIGTANGTEFYDIEKSNSLYSGNGDPFDLTMYGYTMYYHQGTSSDSIYGIDVANFTSITPLDAGQRVGENGGDIAGLNIVGDVLLASVVSGQWWQQDGSGGIAQYNLSTSTWGTSVLPSGQVDRVTAFESSSGNTWISWGEIALEVYSSSGTKLGTWDNLEFPIREIIEYDGLILFATEDGVERFNETSFSWESTWTPGNGLPNNMGDWVGELWTDGTHLVVGSATFAGWGGFQRGVVGHLDGSTGTWSTFNTGQNGVPNGYPLSMSECGSYLYIGLFNNNGGVMYMDLNTSSVIGSFTTSVLSNGRVASVACDAVDTLYVGYDADNQGISKYDTVSGTWLAKITSASNGLPTDPVWLDAMDFSSGKLMIGYDDSGGFAIISTRGAITGQASVQQVGTPVTSVKHTGTEWLIGQAGEASGYSRVDKLGASGLYTAFELPALVSGNIPSMVSDGSKIWVGTESSSGGQGNGGGQGTAGILQGSFNSNGGIDWEEGWSFPFSTTIGDMLMDGTTIYIATSRNGLYVLDTTTGTLQRQIGSIHDSLGGLAMHQASGVSTLYVGLLGTFSTAAGVQAFDVATQQFGAGQLLSGLPSDNIQGFAVSNDHVYVATQNGIGRWNMSANDWDNPLTTADGLPSSNIEDIKFISNTLYIASGSGLTQYIPTTGAITTNTSADGLLGNSVWSIETYSPPSANQAVQLVLGHDGAGSERPGVSMVDSSSNGVVSTHRFDQLPSNYITAVASDYAGLHIATDVGPLIHYDGLSNEFEDGLSSSQISSWPIYRMSSDGMHLMVMGLNAMTIVEAHTASHSSVKSAIVQNPTNVAVGSNGFWLTTSDAGLRGWTPATAFDEMESQTSRYANPLNIGFNSEYMDITNMTHPGFSIDLVTPDAPVSLNSSIGQPGVHGLLFQTVPLIMTSPVSNAAVWAKSTTLRYDTVLELDNTTGVEDGLQLAINNGQLINGTRFVPIKLISPTNGSIEVRLTYDWVRLDTPVEIADMYDRPDDGGGALTVEWTLVHDPDFSRYLVYVSDQPWTALPTDIDLVGRIIDKSESIHSRLKADVTTANGVPLVDGVEYYALVVVEYNNGRYGLPSQVFGPVTTSNEVPTPPEWATAQPLSGGVAGDLETEWARCTALDLQETRIYASTQSMTDILGLSVEASLLPTEGNTTILNLEPGKPYWLGFTCVDLTGQEDMMNATIIGPVVPTGGVDDGIPPAKLQNVWAIDTPADEGGRITVGWDTSDADDCAFYVVYMITGVVFTTDPSSVAGFSESTVVNNCDDNSTIVSELDDLPLVNGLEYHIGVVAFDTWLNGNLNDVEIVTATPIDNSNGVAMPPKRIESIQAYDHPDDDGTAIDVVWSISDAGDFSQYVVWAADKPVDDVSYLWNLYGDDPAFCGCIVIDKQWIDEDKNPIELTLNTALYGLGGNSDSFGPGDTPQLIKPGVELFVTVTVHDVQGNVYTDDLLSASVVPINNFEDTTPPPRLENVSLTDRPMDDGSALLLDFELSSAGDVSQYDVYAASWSFTSVGVGADGPNAPIATLERNPDLPFKITILAGDLPVLPGQETWAAVVPVDSSGNAIKTDLTVVRAQSVDDNVTDPGNYLPSIEGITLAWVEERDILVSWNHSNDLSVEGYQIHISSTDFMDISDAMFLDETIANSFVISSQIFPDLVNTSDWFVSVTTFDDDEVRKTVDAKKINAVDASGKVTDETNAGNDLESLLTTPNLLAAGLVVVSLFLLLAIVRGRGKRSQKEKEWELQTATWGISDDSWNSPPQSNVPPPPPAPAAPVQADSLFRAAERIDSQNIGREQYNAPRPVMNPVRAPIDNDLLNDLDIGTPQQPSKSGIDTSFLDDLL